jgi:two-component system chemotaxis response regulator CheV
MAAMKTNILLEAGTNELEIIEFTVCGQPFGVNVAKVRKVLPFQSGMVTRMADAPPGVEGLIYYQEKPVLLVDLREILRLQGPPPSENRRLALITQFNDLLSSFLIDGVNRIHRLSWKALSPFEETLPGSSACVTGMVTIEGRVIMILDLEHLMAEISPETSVRATLGVDRAIPSDTRRGAVRILYAEDSSLIRRITLQKLREAGFDKVQPFENGQRAYDALAAMAAEAKAAGQPPESVVDLILTDIEMPRMDGLTLCRLAREELGLRRTPVVIYSSLINEQMAAKCRAVGSNAQISKPKIEDIVSVLDQSCGIA